MIRAAALALTALLPACQADETVARYGAADRLWELQTLNGAALSGPATLEFEPGGPVSGRAPCNTFSATNTVPYPWFELTPIVSTDLACDALDAETLYLDALARMTQSEVREGTLFLRNDDNEEMIFTTSD
ncbi:META domain-containing protein [Tateyamaria omphalii]|uniref:META domain-containing protein n=1 Tax=Tateyamaria omphalii TaxID=299262 RepID=UPI001C990D87|nr:META domain-containing protein [Tateyamaria omphalii]MBY5934503.1 META domain-containing protein [Tateyamaria omphalii]